MPVAYSVAILIFFSVAMLLLGITRLGSRRDRVTTRLAQYGDDSAVARAASALTAVAQSNPARGRRLKASKLGMRMANLLSQADLPLTVVEFSLVIMGAAALGFLLGAWRFNSLVGVAIACLCGFMPIVWARRARTKRSSMITNQLPDVLTLIVGALRAGYGLAQAIDVVAHEGPQPSAKEYGRVLHATELGVSLPRALDDMAARVGSDDVDLLISAIAVQYEVGGNLTTILESIMNTIRERIRILREIRVMTAQQRLTGYILALLPVGLAVVISFMQPGFFDPFFEPGLVRLMPVAAIVMMAFAFFLISRILDIKV